MVQDAVAFRDQLMMDAERIFLAPRYVEVIPEYCRRIALVWSELKTAGLPVDDSGGFAVAVFLAIAPVAPTEKELTDFCGLMKLASRTRVRALLGQFRLNGLVEVREASDHAGRLALHATAAMRGHFQRWISTLAELVEPWSGIAAPEVDDAMVAHFLQVTSTAYQQGYVLYEHFSIVGFLMGRRAGYSMFLTLAGNADEGGESAINRAQFAKEHLTSRPHVARLLKECEDQGWLTRKAKDRIALAPVMKQEAMRWIAAEIAWAAYSLRAAKAARDQKAI